MNVQFQSENGHNVHSNVEICTFIQISEYNIGLNIATMTFISNVRIQHSFGCTKNDVFIKPSDMQRSF